MDTAAPYTKRIRAVSVVVIAAFAMVSCYGSAPVTTDQVGHPVEGVVALILSATPEHSLFQGQFCGGVLIEPMLVLTAAHCVAGRDPDKIDVVVGADNLCSTRPIDGVRVAVTQITLHPAFDALSGRYDLATVELKSAMLDARTWSVVEAAQPTVAVAFGWGSSEVGGPGTCRLTANRLNVLPAGLCSRSLSGARAFDGRSMLCAQPADGSTDTCGGDSGGPLFAVDKGDPVSLLGVVSWGYGCGHGAPGVYARADAWAGR